MEENIGAIKAKLESLQVEEYNRFIAEYREDARQGVQKLVALTVMLSIKWVGILIINALLILPAASSRNIATNMREYHLYSVIFSMFSGVLGLFVSYYTNVATGPMIVIIASVIYFSTFIFGRKLKK